MQDLHARKAEFRAYWGTPKRSRPNRFARLAIGGAEVVRPQPSEFHMAFGGRRHKRWWRALFATITAPAAQETVGFGISLKPSVCIAQAVEM